jgi:hypothetical protein
MISDKVRPHHLERKAILYVRQSSAHQVLHNRESSALQYAKRETSRAQTRFGGGLLRLAGHLTAGFISDVTR